MEFRRDAGPKFFRTLHRKIVELFVFCVGFDLRVRGKRLLGLEDPFLFKDRRDVRRWRSFVVRFHTCDKFQAAVLKSGENNNENALERQASVDNSRIDQKAVLTVEYLEVVFAIPRRIQDQNKCGIENDIPHDVHFTGFLLMIHEHCEGK